MLSLFRKNNEAQESPVQELIHELLKRHPMIEVPTECEVRLSDRYNICIPVAIAEFHVGSSSCKNVKYASTKNLSASGMSFIWNEPFDCVEGVGDLQMELLCAFWIDAPFFVRGSVQRMQPFGGNLYEVGVEFTKIIKPKSLSDKVIEDVRKLSLSTQQPQTR